ncbi:hypothetical protein [Candidatus Frankia nodulisporulans]|uniref:hypothetical protein n=1 Tax=Candidatus Frankia nodulisporulans TaxID=2060052 RepID=UPI0013D4DCB3|nr:hypothetical protein [Candidatus Frankia nodulisporulans]
MDERLIVKTRAAKVVVIGGTLFATGGTSFAAAALPEGGFVAAWGTGSTAKAAEDQATSRAEAQCQSGKVTIGPYSYYNTYFDREIGKWSAGYAGNCL